MKNVYLSLFFRKYLINLWIILGKLQHFSNWEAIKLRNMNLANIFAFNGFSLALNNRTKMMDWKSCWRITIYSTMKRYESIALIFAGKALAKFGAWNCSHSSIHICYTSWSCHLTLLLLIIKLKYFEGSIIYITRKENIFMKIKLNLL